MKITITVEVPDTTSESVVQALDAIADNLSSVGYDDGEWSTTPNEDGENVRYRIDQRGFVS